MKALMTGRSQSANKEVESASRSKKGSTHNGLQLNASMESAESENELELKDEVDLAISKCLEDQCSLKKLQITKVSKGQYKLEQKEYTFKLLQGNNLAIKMYAGYIYADCLVHFEEELYKIVK